MSTLFDTRKTHLISFGDGGSAKDYGNGCTGSGYGSPESIKLEPGDEGAVVIDKRPAIRTKAGLKWVFAGPMVNVDLPADEHERCPEPSPMLEQAMAIAGGGFGTLLGMQAASRAAGESRGPLDYVSLPEYVEGWRNVGARIGKVEAGKIVWED